tara:strand:- start:26 stop:2722 length:2697 start_codon:yes stop_codon:yes gene_type:complete
MSDKRYEANIIRATAVEPANNLEVTSAPGVWSLDEVMELQKKDKWPTVGNVTTDVDQVFSTFVYDGNGSTQIIENGIALGNSNDGGSVNFGGAGSLRWVNVPGSSDFGFGTGDFTIELFLFVQTHRNYTEIYDQRTASQDAATATPILYADSSGDIHFFHSNQNKISGAIAAGQWYHIAVSRSGTSTKMFANGTQLGSTYSDSTNYVTPASTWSIGAAAQQNQYEIDGFISNVRVVKGTALYTSNFTAPTSALTAVTNTKLLALQGSTPFVDNSSSSHALTINGGSGASEFGPFTGSSGEGGLVWTKRRGDAVHHTLYDTARGATKRLFSSLTSAETTETNGLTSFNSNGFTVGSAAAENNNGSEIVSWTFRKQAKFFDVVTYTGNGTAGRTISHNLGSVPGMILVKQYQAGETRSWSVYHRGIDSSAPEDYYLKLESTSARLDDVGQWNDTAPTSTEFTVGDSTYVNNNGESYVAYLFAHNNNDGGFGPTGSDDIIKCGSYTGNESTDGPVIDLGFEPQWLLLKNVTSGYNFIIVDVMRGWSAGPEANTLFPNANNAEDPAGTRVKPTSTGFQIITSSNDYNKNGNEFIYMAIRRGPLATPTSATDVFSLVSQAGGYQVNRKATTGFPVDFLFNVQLSPGADKYIYDRMRGGAKDLKSSTTEAEGSNSPGPIQFDFMDGVKHALYNSANTVILSMWRRAPSYFDIVAYSGTGSARTVSHNLGVAPEMMWVKRRNTTNNWKTFHSSLGGTKSMELNTNIAEETNGSALWNSTAPTASVFSLGTASDVNGSGSTYIAYLFATLAGISKVGSFVADGNAQDIDCGFSSGARYVLIKKSSGTFNWRIWDTTRGIVAGDDPYYYLDTDNASTTNGDWVDPYSSGFSITSAFSNGTYVFYAIA